MIKVARNGYSGIKSKLKVSKSTLNFDDTYQFFGHSEQIEHLILACTRKYLLCVQEPSSPSWELLTTHLLGTSINKNGVKPIH